MDLKSRLLTFLEEEQHRAYQYRRMIAEWMYPHDALIDATLEFIIEQLDKDPVALAVLFQTYQNSEDLEGPVDLDLVSRLCHGYGAERDMEAYLYERFQRFGRALQTSGLLTEVSDASV